MSFYLHVGKPYDTLEEVIGIRPSNGSLAEYGISYRQVDLLEGGAFDYDNIKKAINEKTKLVTIQRSKGYADKTKLFRLTDWRTDCICKEYQTRRYLYGR